MPASQRIVAARRSTDLVADPWIELITEKLPLRNLPCPVIAIEASVERVMGQRCGGFALCVGSIARPAIFTWMPDHTRTYRT
jgi:hypothetical protein